MLYALVAHDHPDSLPRRLAARTDHIARLQQLQAEGRLVLAGPLPAIDSAEPGDAGFVGSLIVAEFADLAAARAFADSDPYGAAGVYARVDVFPFKQVMP